MMRTRHTGPSLLTTLGQALNFHHSDPSKHGVVSLHHRDPRAAKHEYLVAERLFLLLDSLMTQRHLSFTWIQQLVVLVNSTVSGAQEILPQLHPPLAQWDEQWVSAYLEDTVRLLDVLNFVRKLLVDLEQRQMLLKLVVTTLNSSCGTVEERRSKAQKCLADYAADGGSQAKCPGASKDVIKVADCSTVLEEMVSQARLNPVQRGRSFLSALYGSKVVAVFLMGMIIRALGGTVRGLSDWQVPERFAWSKPLEELVQLVNKVIGESGNPTNPTQELSRLDQELQELRSRLDSNGSRREVEHEEVSAAGVQRANVNVTDVEIAGSTQSTRDEAWGLQIALKNAEEGVDLVRKEVDSLFHAIVSSRNSLLARLRCSDH